MLIGTMDMYFLIVTEPDFNRIVNGQDPAYAEGITLQMGVDLEGTDEEEIQDFRISTGRNEREDFSCDKCRRKRALLCRVPAGQ